MRMKGRFFFVLLAVFAVILSGCNWLAGNKERIDPPQSVTYEDDLEGTDGGTSSEETAENTVQTELYLIDKNGYVVPRTFSLPNTQGVAAQALEYLVAGGPVSERLPQDFRAVLPPGTEFSVDVRDGIATVDFSKEFSGYAPEDEQRIVQAVTWTLTQFDSIKGVKLRLNGKDLSEMPVDKTPLPDVLTRKSGINLEQPDVVDIANTKPVTLYYIAQTDHDSYYVPVTKRVKGTEKDLAARVVEELIKGPAYDSKLFSLFNPDARLVEEPKIEDGVVTLNFNENILGSYDKKLINENLLNMIVLSLTELDGIEGVSVEVNGDKNLVNEDGKNLTEPVSRPKKVNASGF